MKRRRKTGSRATNKRSAGEKEEYQGMAIRSMGYNKAEKQKNKNTAGDAKNLDHRPDITNKPQKVEQQEKVADSTTTTPEVFDSSKYNAATELKEAANMKEGEHLKEVLMSVDKKEPLNPENLDTGKLMDNSQPPRTEALASTAEIVSNDVNPPSLEDRAAVLRGSKEPLDNGSQDNKILTQQDGEYKQKEDEKQEEINKDYPQAAPMWPNLINAWSDLYVESAKNMATITEYWINLFSIPWLGGYKKGDTKKKDKVKVE
jgi:hypothetical protein